MTRTADSLPCPPRGLRREAAEEHAVCWPWHLWWLVEGAHPIESHCRFCRRDVALPRAEADKQPVCLYCAMDRGLVEAVEIPFDAECGVG